MDNLGILMTKLLLSLHVLVVIIAIGPVTVAASMFPSAARRAIAEPDNDRHLAVLRVLHRVCLVYAAVGIAVPVFGFATASSLGVLRNAWLIVSILLTVIAAGVLGLLVLPRQDAVLSGLIVDLKRLAIYTGTFNVLWVVVTVLMIVRPGSTTGA